jgi:hypothetical protein
MALGGKISMGQSHVAWIKNRTETDPGKWHVVFNSCVAAEQQQTPPSCTPPICEYSTDSICFSFRQDNSLKKKFH